MKTKAARRGKGAASPPKLEINGLIQKEIRTLDDADKEKAAVAAASLAMLAQSVQGAHGDLLDAIPKLISIMLTASNALQRNACVALISIVHGGEQPWKVASNEGAVSAAVSLMESPKQNPGLRLDAAVLAGAMVEGGTSGPQDFYRENGLDALVPLLTPETDGQLLEAAVDIICKLASIVTARKALSDAGIPKKLATLTGMHEQPETLVRVLMGLAMLLSSAPGHLTDFAEVPRAIDNLAVIIRSSEDQDSKAIATSIFANLANAPGTREAVTKALASASTGNDNKQIS